MQKAKSKVAVVVIAVAGLLSAVTFIYIFLAKKQLPPAAAKSESPIDITPLLANKLQQLITTSSDSLYHLSIGQLKPDILASQVEALQVSLTPDSTILAKLDKEEKAPDDVFTITFDTLKITGINLTDFLHKKDIRLDTILVSSPQIGIAHTDRAYNAAIRKKDSGMTLYQKLTQQFTSLSIGAVIAKEGNLTTTNLSGEKKTTKLNKVSIQISDIKIDSLTQHDTSRFFFSKAADFSCRDYTTVTVDSLYTLTIGSLSISADQHRLAIKGITFEPRGGKAAFERQLKTRDDMVTVRFPSIVANDVDWWALLNRQSLYAGEITISNGSVKDYFDRSLPSSGKPTRKDNYPQQMLKELTFPMLIRKMNIKGLDVSYEEFNPTIKRSGTITFNNLTGSINNITNVAAQIKVNPQTTCSVDGLFMNKVPVTASFSFNLARLRTGAFSSRFHLKAVPNTLLNPVAEPLGMYTLQSGTVDETNISVTGDNYTANTSITMLYHDLRIFPLKKADSSGDMKKGKLAGFLANTFIIKGANPGGNKEPRHYEVPVQRDKSGGSFFNFLWQAILTGIVKTIGLPKKFADQ